jgi:hypothetical protein
VGQAPVRISNIFGYSRKSQAQLKIPAELHSVNPLFAGTYNKPSNYQIKTAGFFQTGQRGINTAAHIC